MKPVNQPLYMSGNLSIDWGRWDDPGDYPNAVASGPLPSYDYVEDIVGDLQFLINNPSTIVMLSQGAVTNDQIERQDPELFQILEENKPSGIKVLTWGCSQVEVREDGVVFSFTVLSFSESDWSEYD